MTASLKKIIKYTLGRFGLKLVRVKLLWVSYYRLYQDLALFIPDHCPTVLDVGANQGQTIDSLLSVFKRPRIFAFEPAAEVFKLLEEKKYGSNISLYNFALGNQDGEREFINYQWSTMSSFLKLDPDKSNQYRDLAVTGTEIVKIKTVDDFVAKSNITCIDLLKTDTQGFDLDVLRGASRSLQSGVIKHVLVEVNFVKMYQGQATAVEINSLLNDNGLFLIEYYEKVRKNNTILWCTALYGRRESVGGEQLET